MDESTRSKVDRFISEGKELGIGFNETKWELIEETIPPEDKLDAELEAREGLKEF